DQRKLRTREHVIADLGVNFTERRVLLAGFTLERIIRDYGIDLVLVTYTAAGEVQNGLIFLQVKATDHVKWVANRESLACQVERADLRAWLSELLPVILVVYDAAADVAYWLHVQGYFRDRPNFNLFAAGKTVAVRVPVAQELNPDAVRQFARL